MNSPSRNVDIAIIGLSCRFPGAATTEQYWRNLCDGVESVTFFSDQELVSAGIDPALVANPNYVKAAPILPNVEMFDASFFGYSPKDATLMDSSGCFWRFLGRRSKTQATIQLVTREKSVFFPVEEGSLQAI
jgi:acyl transferase domain-containing protein